MPCNLVDGILCTFISICLGSAVSLTGFHRYAYRSGVTTAISSNSNSDTLEPDTDTFKGISVAFHTGALHGLEEDAIIKPQAAVHVTLFRNFERNGAGISLSTRIAALKSLLSGVQRGEPASKKFG